MTALKRCLSGFLWMPRSHAGEGQWAAPPQARLSSALHPLAIPYILVILGCLTNSLHLSNLKQQTFTIWASFFPFFFFEGQREGRQGGGGGRAVAVKVPSPNHRTTRELPYYLFLRGSSARLSPGARSVLSPVKLLDGCDI